MLDRRELMRRADFAALATSFGTTKALAVLKNLALDGVRRAFDAKEVRAVLFVMPLSEKYLSLV